MKAIKKVVHRPDRQASLVSQLIDRKIEAKVSHIESQMTRMLRVLKLMKKAMSPARLDALEKEVTHVKQVLEEFNVKSLEEDIFKKFGHVNRKIESSLAAQKREIEKTEDRLASLKNALSAVKDAEGKLEALQPEKVQREIESLRTKIQWIELEMEKMNVSDLLERIDELESRLDALRISQPTIIE